MFKVVIIPLEITVSVLPQDFQNILDTVFRSTWRIGNRTVIGLDLGCETFEKTAFVTWRYKWFDQESLSLKSLCSSINVIAYSALFAVKIESKRDVIQVFSGLNVVKTTNYDVKSLVKTERKLLDSFLVGNHFYSRTSLHDKLRYDVCLEFSNISLSKKKLSV